MAQIYTQQKLDRLHSTRTAVDGRLYRGPTGVLYIGNSEGFLERSKDLKGDANSQTLENTNTSIDGRPVTAPKDKGDIMVDNGTSIVPFPVGEDGQYLSANSSESTGMEWKDLPAQGNSASWSAARKRKSTDSYLEMNEVFMNEVPIVLAEDMVLDTIIATSSSAGTWDAEIHDDQSLIPGATVSVTTTSNSAKDLDIDLPAGTQLMFYISGTLVEKPRITIICKNKI